MRNSSLLLLVWVLIVSSLAQANDGGAPADPYAAVERIELANGLVVYFAPSSDATVTSIRVEVDTGWEAEVKPNWGVAHLLEHNLFRDKELKDDMSYLQLIKEAGGSANGSTEGRLTAYFGTIPAPKSAWMLEKFTKMILDPELNEQYLEKEKGTVELEIGRPGPVSLVLGMQPLEKIFPAHLWNAADFWRSEFGASFQPPFTKTDEQLANRRLTLKTVSDFYHDFYYPANMRLFIAGKFDRTEIQKIIDTQWASRPARNGKKLPPLPVAKPTDRPYLRSTVADLESYVSIGTKVWQASSREETVLDSYVEYLAHRLMKDVRNTKGQTYSAYGTTTVFDRYGYTTVSFQTPKEHLDENLQLAREYLQKEAYAGALTEAQVKEAVDLYQAKYRLMTRDAEGMMNIARRLEGRRRTFGTLSSPYRDLQETSAADYNATLKKYFTPDQAFEDVYRPPLLFPYDRLLLNALTLLAAFFVLRRLLTRPFAHDDIRWVRKVRYPPFKIYEAGALFIGLIAFLHLYVHVQTFFGSQNFFRGNILLSSYAKSVFEMIALVSVFQGILSLLPQKLMVVGRELVIKSTSYFSHRIDLEHIEFVEAVPQYQSYAKLGSIRHRFWTFHFFPWKKGLYLRLKNGKAWYFDVREPEKACAELRKHLKPASGQGTAPTTSASSEAA